MARGKVTILLLYHFNMTSDDGVITLGHYRYAQN